MRKRAASRRKSSTDWTIAGLPAQGPAPGLRSQLHLFGQFIGDWDIVDPKFRSSRSGSPPRTGEVHFNWILGGRAIQDVWGPTDARTKRLIPVGTTIRYYDPDIAAWRSTWLSPLQREVRRFIGRQVGSKIVLQEENRGLRTERWVFADIRPNSFRWYAVRRRRRGGPWYQFEEMRLLRRGRSPTQRR
jgi:hypothetical protein